MALAARWSTGFGILALGAALTSASAQTTYPNVKVTGSLQLQG